MPSLEGDSAVFQLRGAPHGYRDSDSVANVFNSVGVDGSPQVIVFENASGGQRDVLRQDVVAVIRSMLSGTAMSGRNEETNFTKCIFVFSGAVSQSELTDYLGVEISRCLDSVIEFKSVTSNNYVSESLAQIIRARLSQCEIPRTIEKRISDPAWQKEVIDASTKRGLRRTFDQYLRILVAQEKAAAGDQ